MRGGVTHRLPDRHQFFMQTDNALTYQNTGLQFQLVEGFNQVVIGSSVHRLQHVFLVILSGQQDNV